MSSTGGGGKEKGRAGGKEGGRKEGGQEEGREGGKEGGRKEGGQEGGREGKHNVYSLDKCIQLDAAPPTAMPTICYAPELNKHELVGVGGSATS